MKNDLTKVKAMGMEKRHGIPEGNSPMPLEEEGKKNEEAEVIPRFQGESI